MGSTIMDAGVIFIVTVIELNQAELEIIKTVVDPERIEILWVGYKVTTDNNFDHHFYGGDAAEEACTVLKECMQEKGVIFKVW